MSTVGTCDTRLRLRNINYQNLQFFEIFLYLSFHSYTLKFKFSEKFKIILNYTAKQKSEILKFFETVSSIYYVQNTYNDILQL